MSASEPWDWGQGPAHVPCSVRVVLDALEHARAAAPTITLTRHDMRNLAEIVDTWNHHRARENLGLPLTPADALRRVLETTATLLRKDPA